mmetsp:Transcript_2824/g.6588  ORF Transcript_2824/g.6588 Transcript_2824/m.6588 type:complete len:212 (-) Transcript_2824:240-875(-)
MEVWRASTSFPSCPAKRRGASSLPIISWLSFQVITSGMLSALTNFVMASASMSPSKVTFGSSNDLKTTMPSTSASLATASSVMYPNGLSRSSATDFSVSTSFSAICAITTASPFFLNSSTLSLESRRVRTGPIFFITQETMVSFVRPPSYSLDFPFLNQMRVGYPRTSYFFPSSLSSVASTLARTTSSSFSFSAAASYSGANRLQCPHHGA